MEEEIGEYHPCHFCGDLVRNGVSAKGDRHWLSDCRPDLVQHDVGENCTWFYKNECYAFQDRKGKWTTEHIHFYSDGPM